MVAHQDTRHLGSRQRSEPQTRAPGTDRREQCVRCGRDQEEHGRRGRLLESLEQCALGSGCHRIGVIDDYHPAAPFEGTIRGAIDDVTYLLDLDRSGIARFDDDDIRVRAATDPPTLGAGAAGVDTCLVRHRSRAVEDLRQRLRRAPLTHTPGARKNQGWWNRVLGHGAAKQCTNPTVAGEGAKGHSGCSPSGDRIVACGLLPIGPRPW